MKENLEEIEDSVRDTLGLVNDLDLEDAGKNLFQAVESFKGKGARAELARLRDEIVNLAIEIAKALAPARKHMAHYELILTILDKLEAAGHPGSVASGGRRSRSNDHAARCRTR